ncbi:glycosyltransferase family 4 protein [Modestobacter italicus]|uniref:glycosyltransferase family 4 protein n=1 Tax=Modestobacter italicus (strain DSM 44449 / CECT 9708 / BC 501) TaxID=2732864 RepID=UPI001C962C87|nr:glycosyltransferase family 1 protein [Modestobacter italicus]
MRVAVVQEQILAPVPGGTGRYTRELVAALAATAPEGAQVTGWTGWYRDVGPAQVPGVAGPRRLPLPRRALAEAWRRGIGPRPRGADVVHAPTLQVPPATRAPLVVTVHDAVPWTHPETMTPRGVAWHRDMAGHAAARAAAIVVPTQAVAEEIVRYLPVDGRVTVIGEGVTDRLAVPVDAARRARALGLPEDGRFLLSLATLEPRKGLDVLLAALATAGAPEVPLLLVGQPGWGGIDPERTAERLGLPAGRVRVLGRLSDADLATVLDRSTALVAPSRAEGFGLPVLEAMAAGVPVVSSAAAALVEVGGGATVTTPVGDAAALAEALARVVEDAGLRAELSAAGRTRAASFSWAGAARRTWELYGSL